MKYAEKEISKSTKSIKKSAWYRHGWGLLIAILFFPYFFIWYIWAKSKFSKGIKITITALIVIVLLPVLIVVAIDDTKNQTSNRPESNMPQTSQQNQQSIQSDQVAPKTEKQIMLERIGSLIAAKDAFDAGSYVRGDIPVGEYIFMPFEGSGKYYSENDSADNIIDNENFDSFGYVYVQGAGNIQTQGVLIKIQVLEQLGVTNAKEIYEKLNDNINYKDSGMYKIGTDLPAGTYTIESYGQGYIEVTSGPVGNSDIISNEIVNGKYSVNVLAGQYLKVSRGKVL